MIKKFKQLINICLISVLISCSSGNTESSPSPTNSPDVNNNNNSNDNQNNSEPLNKNYSIVKAFPEEFTQPVFLTNAKDGTDRLFIVEQTGKIQVYDKETNISKVFLDISDKVKSGGELGLLGLSFHPDYKNNGLFFVNYNVDNPLKTIISKFKVDTLDSNIADKASEEIILEFEQPYSNHNGGMLDFGKDGYLYIGVGDGGSGGDPENNGQNPKTLLGSILRIDINSSSGNKKYSIPENNPFINNNDGKREEIFAYGLRNPWRFSFDNETGTLWAADVGQNKYEEVHIIESGKNYGWNIIEGSHCYKDSNCDKTGLELPISEYDHSEGKSITGGYIYRGSKYPNLFGSYIYADFVSGRIWYLRYNNSKIEENEVLLDTNLKISSFGIDENNELYILDYSGGIYGLTQE